MSILRHHHISFKNAFRGLYWAFTTQPNFKVHITLSFIALFLCFWLDVSYLEWVIIIFTIVLGISSEMINTSLESMTDLITTKWHKEAKIAKDVAAGMMILTSFGALLVAGLIFIPKISNLFFR